jgi:membrane protein DedA with SNARE-associated domain
LRLLEYFIELPSGLLYTLLGLASAMENIFPLLPADTFVVLGGGLAATAGTLSFGTLFLTTWMANVGSALVTYRAGFLFGRPLLTQIKRRHFLDDRRLMELDIFCRQRGAFAIFITRFLPGLRVAVPVVAGIMRMNFLTVSLAIGSASAIWYSLLLYVGLIVGRNLNKAVELKMQLDIVVGLIAIVLVLGCYLKWRNRCVEDL